jgi:NADPH:quinone reductase-like Zn-dependent oxidoreductase
MNATMKRWELPAFGRDQLRLREVAVPEPGPGEVLVKVGASSINYRDRKMVEDGFGYGRPGDAPERAFTPGSDLAGDVVATGPRTRRFRVGERVLSVFAGGWIDGEWPGAGGGVQNLGGVRTVGTWAEYVVLPEDWLVAAPASLDVAAAGTLTTAGLTAWTALVDGGGFRPGQTVVVQGTGGVALFALQFAAAMGAHVIVVTAGEDKVRRALALGAAHAIDRTAVADWAGAVRELTGGRGADHVLELIGGDNLARSLDALANGGTVSLIGFLDSFDSRLPAGPMIAKRARIQGQMVGHRRGLEDMVRAIEVVAAAGDRGRIRAARRAGRARALRAGAVRQDRGARLKRRGTP